MESKSLKSLHKIQLNLSTLQRSPAPEIILSLHFTTAQQRPQLGQRWIDLFAPFRFMRYNPMMTKTLHQHNSWNFPIADNGIILGRHNSHRTLNISECHWNGGQMELLIVRLFQREGFSKRLRQHADFLLLEQLFQCVFSRTSYIEHNFGHTLIGSWDT